MKMNADSRDPNSLIELMQAALGSAPLDLVIEGGQVLDVYRGQWVEADVGFKHGRVVSFGPSVKEAEQRIDATGKWVVPGFFESHFHAGGSHLTPTELAAALIERGTTSTVCDFQEHYSTSGIAAAREALDEAKAAGLRVFYLVPLQQFVVRQLGVTGVEMTASDMKEMLDWPETVAINEPPPASVFANDPDVLEIIAEALARGLVYSGHAPEYSGSELQAYIASGPSSDHESRDAEAAWMKLGLGLKVMMREGSAAPDLGRIISLAAEYPAQSRHMMLCSDEVDPLDLVRQGHMDHKIRVAIEAGVDPVVAFQMASLNPAEYYRVDHEIGSLAPGRFGDAVILSDLESVEIAEVISGGRSWTPPAREETPPVPEISRSEIKLAKPLAASDFELSADGAEKVRVRVIGVSDGSLVSRAEEDVIEAVDGVLRPAPEQDLLMAAMIDPYTGTSETGHGFVSGFNIRDGAVATTYQNPYWNLFIAGKDGESMALAGNRVKELGAGIVVVSGGEVVAEWPLPMAMVFSDKPLAQVHDDFLRMNDAIRSLGCDFKAPVLALTFTPLVTIPAYGLSSKGLYDVNRGEYVSPVISG